MRQIQPNSAYVWHIEVDTWEALAACRTYMRDGGLSLSELRKAEMIRSSHARREYLAAHEALRVILGQYLDISPCSVQFYHDPCELDRSEAWMTFKPRVVVPGILSHSLDLRFNLSHSNGRILIGVTNGLEIGVDIEWCEPIDGLAELATEVMSTREISEWMPLGEKQRFYAFYNVWTRKEAYLKAIGLGMLRNPRDVTVPLLPASLMNSSVGIVRDNMTPGDWVLHDISVPGDYSASICYKGRHKVALIACDLTDASTCSIPY